MPHFSFLVNSFFAEFSKEQQGDLHISLIVPNRRACTREMRMKPRRFIYNIFVLFFAHCGFVSVKGTGMLVRNPTPEGGDLCAQVQT